MFPPTDNPAKRLLEVLNRAKHIKNQSVLKMWAEIFDIEKINLPICYLIVGHLNGLVDSVEARIYGLPDLNHGLYLRDLPTIRSIICVANLNQNWHEIKGPLDKGVLTGLEFCASELSKAHSEDVLSETDLESIRSDFTAVLGAVEASGISADLKLVLFDILTSAILAIDHYKILGNDGLKKAVAYAIGSLSLHRDAFVGEGGEGVVTSTLSVFNRLANVLTVAYKLKEIGGGICNFLKLDISRL